MSERLTEGQIMRRAIANASYALNPNQGERPDSVRAWRWLATTFPVDHPNYCEPPDDGVPREWWDRTSDEKR